jgi:signal peptidase II
LLLALLVVVLDQLSKRIALAWLVPFEPMALLPGFNLTLMFNTGAAFSLLAEAAGWQRWFFIALALAVGAVLIVWMRRLPIGNIGMPLSLSLILGGALGNVIDRILYGHVIDFIDVYWRNWHWPAFNLADSAIVVGAVLLMLLSLREQL